MGTEFTTKMLEPVLTSEDGARHARLPFSNGATDAVSVARNGDGTVTVTILMGLAEQPDGDEWPEEGMGEITLPAAVWAHLAGLSA